MDSSTQQFLARIKKNLPCDVYDKINYIWEDYIEYDEIPLTIETIQKMFIDIDKLFYGKRLIKFLTEERDIPIQYKNVPRDPIIKNYFAAGRYEESEPEWISNDFYLEVSLDDINKTKSDDDNLYVSGGYYTESRVKWVVLGLLHESIHLIEFRDKWIKTIDIGHTLFFYKWGFHVFGMLSQLGAPYINPDDLYPEPSDRITNIKRIKNCNLMSDGVKILDDYSEIFIGYERQNRYISYYRPI